MNVSWPLELTEDEMLAQSPAVTRKTELVVLSAENCDPATYVRHYGRWVLLDAERHGHGSAA